MIYEDKLVKLHCGDCIEIMRGMEENSIDAIITDPPYGLEFMGKDWDKLNLHNSPDAKGNYPKSRNVRGVKIGEDLGKFTRNLMNPTSEADIERKKKYGKSYSGRRSNLPDYNAKYMTNQMQLWHYQWAVEALRVVKPGGYLLSFGGTRTFHRLACAIEDAGFEFRDTVMWVYGSGFPKSLDVSKAIDKMKGAERGKILIPTKKGNLQEMAGAIALGATGFTDISKPITPEAKEWEGWGTALKPAWEPILIFRKPLIGTVAENVLKYGTGAMNIDASRVEVDARVDDMRREIDRYGRTEGSVFKTSGFKNENNPFTGVPEEGRFPANLVHDGSEEVEELFPEQSSGAMTKPYEYTNTGFSLGKPAGETKQIHESNSGSASRFFKRFPANLVHDGSEEVEELFPDSDGCQPHNITSKNKKYDGWGNITEKHGEQVGYEGTGSASRFFYCSKADKGERELGLEGEEGELMDEGREEGSPGGTNPRNRGSQRRKNIHPTVKPVGLMKWLINLVTREDSVILDPFAGSGSTLVACKKLGRKVVGIEQSKEYCEITKKRLKAPLQKTFF